MFLPVVTSRSADARPTRPAGTPRTTVAIVSAADARPPTVTGPIPSRLTTGRLGPAQTYAVPAGMTLVGVGFGTSPPRFPLDFRHFDENYVDIGTPGSTVGDLRCSTVV